VCLVRAGIVRHLSVMLFVYLLCSRQTAMQAGLREAIEVPLGVIRLAAGCWPHLVTLAEHGNATAISDVQVCMVHTGLYNSYRVTRFVDDKQLSFVC